MPEIVCDAAARVVEHDGLTIDELVGNVASTSDRISVAHVKVANETSEPWLTLDYDEWMCVTRGRMVLHHAGGQLEVCAGQTVFIRRGERFRPFFDANTEYLPVCLPAFRPDRCVREEVVESGVCSTRCCVTSGGAPAIGTLRPGRQSSDARSIIGLSLGSCLGGGGGGAGVGAAQAGVRKSPSSPMLGDGSTAFCADKSSFASV
jgi:mannose-6-phosphate isomerase-like protein (cupin superfamily)